MYRTMRTEADLHDYVAAFNRRDYERQHTYYHPDVTFTLPNGREFVGSHGIAAHYERLHACVRELLQIDFCVIGDEHIAIEIYTEFRAFADYPDFTFGALRAGDVYRCTNFGHYDLVDGRLHRIRVGTYRVWRPDERLEPKRFPGIADPEHPDR